MDQATLFDVRGKIICVTGASSGLGRGAATMFANQGAKTVGVARREDELETWHRVTSGATSYVAADLSDRDGLKDIAGAVCEPFGPPDILINAAGINTRQHADEVTPDQWDLTLTLNLSTPFFLAQAFVPAMKEKGWGRIVNFASLQSRRAFENGISYGASKGGVEQMTRAMAESWSKFGVLSNAIAPGFFHTELTEKVFSDSVLSARIADQTCIGRNGEIGDLEGPLLFLCSAASNYVTGQVLFVDGGFTAK